MATFASTRAFAPTAVVSLRMRARRTAPVCAATPRDDASNSRVTLQKARGGTASSSKEDRNEKESGVSTKLTNAGTALFNACTTLVVVSSVATTNAPAAFAAETRKKSGADSEMAKESLAAEAKKDFLKLEQALNKDLIIISREIEIDKELLERDVERVPVSLEQFLAKEPPILVGMLAIAVINGFVGLTWALFFRETAAGPGGEFGKGVKKLRGEVVKGIFKFFGSVMGSYTTRSNMK